VLQLRDLFAQRRVGLLRALNVPQPVFINPS
jgi:hypothetical protein